MAFPEMGGLKEIYPTKVCAIERWEEATQKDCLKSWWIEREEATQKLNFRALIVALDSEDFGNGRLQEHYYLMVKTTLICE